MKKRFRACAVILAMLIHALSIDLTAELFLIPLEHAWKPASLAGVKTCDAHVVLSGELTTRGLTLMETEPWDAVPCRGP